MKKIKSYLPLITLVLVAAAASLAVYKSNIKQNLGKENFANQPFFTENKEIRGLFNENEALTAEDFINDEGRYSVVNIFASWCSTCLTEHEALFEIAKNESLNLYGIAWNDYSENAKNYLQKFGNPYHKVALDSKGKLNKLLGVAAVPETFLINPDGIIIYRHQGAIKNSTIKKLLKARK